MTQAKLIIRPSAGEILKGADAELIELSKRARLAERAADRQTAKALELKRRLRESEASEELAAEVERLRAELADYLIIVGMFTSGNTELGERLAAVVAPTAGRLASRIAHDPERLVTALAERSELRRSYVYDVNGHRVRADQVDASGQCPRCKREKRRLARASQAS